MWFLKLLWLLLSAMIGFFIGDYLDLPHSALFGTIIGFCIGLILLCLPSTFVDVLDNIDIGDIDIDDN